VTVNLDPLDDPHAASMGDTWQVFPPAGKVEKGARVMAEPVHNGGNQAGKSDRFDTAERERLAIEFRKAGMSYQTIATRLGYANASGAWKAVNRVMSARVHEAVDALRTLEGERLDAMLRVCFPRAIAGSLWHVDRVLAIHDRRVRMFGLLAPRRVAVSGAVTLQQLAERACADTDLDPKVVLALAEQLLRDDLNADDAS
jgi:hypothetical protein